MSLHVFADVTLFPIYLPEKNETEPHFQTKITFVQNIALASRPQISESALNLDTVFCVRLCSIALWG